MKYKEKKEKMKEKALEEMQQGNRSGRGEEFRRGKKKEKEVLCEEEREKVNDVRLKNEKN